MNILRGLVINNFFNQKSKELKVSKKILDKIFKPLNPKFLVEINVENTSIIKYLNKKTNNLIHFYNQSDSEIFREIRDNHKNVLAEIKKLKFENKHIEKYDDRQNQLFNFIKKSQANSEKISTRKIKNDIEKISKDLNGYYISNANSLDVVKAFNDEDNIIIIHLNPVNYLSFFKIHGNFLIFHKAKILLIGNNIDIDSNIALFKKYHLKPLYKNLTKNCFYSKNF